MQKITHMRIQAYRKIYKRADERVFCPVMLVVPEYGTRVQQNFNGSNTFGTMKKGSRQGVFELMSVNHSARSGNMKGIYFRFSII